MNKFDRYYAVMRLLDQTTLEQLANFAAGKFVMILEECRDGTECWWCPADVEDHTGEVIHTSEKAFANSDLAETLRNSLETLGLSLSARQILENASTVYISRPGVAYHALQRILKEENDVLVDEILRPYVDGLTTSILA